MFRKMRRAKQEIPTSEACEILQEEKRGVLSVIGDNGYPYGVPMSFYYDVSENRLYFHSAVEGHKIDAVRNNDKVCFTAYSDIREDEDGWSRHLISVIAMGRAVLISDRDKTADILRKLGLKYFPDKDMVEEDLQKNGSRAQVIEMRIEHISGKRVHEK